MITKKSTNNYKESKERYDHPSLWFVAVYLLGYVIGFCGITLTQTTDHVFWGWLMVFGGGLLAIGRVWLYLFRGI